MWFMPTYQDGHMSLEILPFPHTEELICLLDWWMNFGTPHCSCVSINPKWQKGKESSMGIPLAWIWLLPRQLTSSQPNRSRCIKLVRVWGVLSLLQKLTMIGQSLRRCRMYSSWFLHKGQNVSHIIPLDSIIYLKGTLLWKHSHKKCLLFGKISIFKIELPRKGWGLTSSSLVKL